MIKINFSEEALNKFAEMEDAIEGGGPLAVSPAIHKQMIEASDEEINYEWDLSKE